MIDFRRIPEMWRRWDVTVRDLPLALLLVASSVLPPLSGQGTQLGWLPDRPLDAPAGLVIAFEALPLAIRRRWPAVCIMLVSLAFAVDQLRAYHTAAASALPIALISAGAHLEKRRRLILALLSAGYVALAIALTRLGSGEATADLVIFYVILGIFWWVGAWLRQTRIAEAERRRHVAESTRTAERTRIARELHDVVTHHVTAMVVQAEAARYLAATPDRLDETLVAVSATGRRAISDLRHLLDVLNPDHGTEPRTPAVGRLHELVDQTRQAGQPVEFVEEGSPQQEAGSAEVAAYRVVQEALTNALKYDHGARTTVHVDYGTREITVEVSSAGSGSGHASPGGSGRGLEGLRERVGVLGGDFSAGRRPEGGFVVRARIPAGSPS